MNHFNLENEFNFTVFLSFILSPLIIIFLMIIIMVMKSCHFFLCSSVIFLLPFFQDLLGGLHAIYWLLSLLNFSHRALSSLFYWIFSLFYRFLLFYINNFQVRLVEIIFFLRLIEFFQRLRFIEIVSSLWLFVVINSLLFLFTCNIRFRVSLSVIG